MKIYRSYKYLLKPTEIQKEKIFGILKNVTYVHNRFVQDYMDGKNINVKAKELLKIYREENHELINTDGSALMNEIFKLQYGRVLKRKRERCNSYTTSNLYKQAVEILSSTSIYIPKVGAVMFSYYRPIPEGGEIVNSTIKIDNLKNYYICLNVKFNKERKEINLDISKCIGLDYSSPHFCIDDQGRKINMPHFNAREEERIAKINKKLAKCQKGSENYRKIKNKVLKLYKKSSNQRYDFLHKLSTKYADEYDYVFIEDLDIQGIAKSKYHLQKQTYDNAYALFVSFLNYKMNDRGKKLVKVNRYYPSSKTCHVCGYINNSLKLSDRQWICPGCKTLLDRDINSAINIKNEGLRIVQLP